MTGRSEMFGNPKSNSPGVAMIAAPGSADESGSGPASDEAVARSIAADLQRLHDQDVRAEREGLKEKYDRLAAAYAHGLHLRDDEGVRLCFFAKDLWRDFRGHKPDPTRHGPDDAVRFAVMGVCGGSARRRQEASMFASACWAMARLGVREDEFLDRLTRGGGPKRWAALAAELRRRQSCESSPHDARTQEEAKDEKYILREPAEPDFDAGPQGPTSRKPRELTLKVPDAIAGCDLPPMALYYAAETRELLLSALPGSYHPVHIHTGSDV